MLPSSAVLTAAERRSYKSRRVQTFSIVSQKDFVAARKHGQPGAQIEVGIEVHRPFITRRAPETSPINARVAAEIRNAGIGLLICLTCSNAAP